MKDMERSVKLVRESGIFDEQWYLNEYPDVGAMGMCPATHYLRIGARIGRNPGPGFDAARYLKCYEDVAAAQLNPLLHYLNHGRLEGREVCRVEASDHDSVVEVALVDSDDRFTILPAPGGRLPDLFRLRALQPKSRIAVVAYIDSLDVAGSVDRFAQEQADEFDLMAIYPLSLSVKHHASAGENCKRLVTAIYPDRYGAAAAFMHMVEADILTQYDAVCWVCGNADEVSESTRGLAALIRDHAEIGIISQRVAPGKDWGGPLVKQMLGTFLPRLGRKTPPIPVDRPTGVVVWINPLLLRQLRALHVRPDELLGKLDKPDEEGRIALQALLGVFANEGGMEQLDFASARKRMQPKSKGATAKLRKVKAIAFYLPQFHPVPENDRWWGNGFTEWNNVVRARPLFRAHNQPRVPADLGYYDLRTPETRDAQAQLARSHGLHGFCYYYYWFNGKKMLNSPIEQMLASGRPDLPFCVCWANENWSRNWDGQNRHVLLEQHYSLDSNRAFIREMIPMMKDPRYIRHHGKPVLVVYRIRIIPNWRETAEMWREECRRAGLGEIHLCAVRFGLEPLDGQPEQFGVDSYVLFPPHETTRVDVRSEQLDLSRSFNGELFSYDAVVDGDIARFAEGYPWPVHRGAMMSWDNTARRLNDSRIFVGSTPSRFRYWLKNIVEQEARFNRDDESLIFINAWNEWAEGTYLEPDQRFGTGYLGAVKSALAECDTGPVQVPSTVTPRLVMPKPAPAGNDPLAALTPPTNIKRGVAALPKWHQGERQVLPGAPSILLCAHISGHQLFGGERSFLDVLDAMGRMHLNVIVTLPSGNNKPYLDEVRKRTVGVHVFSYPQWIQDRAADESLVLVFADIIARHQIDLVHANTIVLLEPLIAARRMKRIALVHSRELITLDESLRDRIGLPSQEIIRRVFGLSDFLVANSRATAGVFRREGRTFYVPNAVRPDDLDLENKIEGSIKFAIVSSNIPKKGVADFIEVARLCGGHVDNAEFVVIGPENKLIEEWRAEQKRGDIPANVKFIGYRETPQQAMSEANVILNLSSFAESFGRTVAEALMARRPVIAYEWGALPELVQHGSNGFLVPYRNTAEVARHVIGLCKNPDQIAVMGELGRASMQDGFTPDKLHRNLLDAYETIFDRPLDPELVPEDSSADAISSQPNRGLTVVIPVFNAYDEVRTCLESVVRNTDLTSVRVLIINDGSSDPRVTELLAEYRDVAGVRVKHNDHNIGYTKTVNIGLREAADDDVVLLNSDTIVTPQWVEGLRSTAYRHDHTGTVTAMSDNAGAFSFPTPGRANPKPAHVSHDDFAASVLQMAAACQPVEVPTGSGFCMFIRRELIAKIGAFDEEAFPRGYGEENDFCMRAMVAGWENLISPHVFVFHVRSASFGEEKVELVRQGVNVVTNRYPEYAKLTKAAFSSESMQALQHAVAEAISAMATCD